MAFGNRDLKKGKRWSEIIEKQRESGKTPTQFCGDEGLNVSQFYYWNGILAKRQKEKKPAQLPEDKITIPFVPLKIPDNLDFNIRRDFTEQIEISKIVLRISANTDNSTLACIIQSLEKA